MEGIDGHTFPVIKKINHKYVKDSTGNIVNRIVKLCVVTVTRHHCDRLVMYINVKSLGCTPETNVIWHVNYSFSTAIKIR